MICPNCGADNTDSIGFCTRCGQMLPTVQPLNNNVYQPQSATNNTFFSNNVNQQNMMMNSNISQNYMSTNSNMNYNFKNKNLNRKKRFSKNIFIIPILVILLGVGIYVYFNFFNNDTKKLAAIFDPDLPIIISEDSKYGYIDSNGKVIIEPKYENAGRFYGNYAVVKTRVTVDNSSFNTYQVIDKKGNVKASSMGKIEYVSEYNIYIIEDALYNGNLRKISSDNVRVSYVGNGYLEWTNSDKKKGGIMTPSGKVTYTYKFNDESSWIDVEPSNNSAYFDETYCRITAENKVAIVNCDTGKVIYDFVDKHISLEKNNIFEVYDKDIRTFNLMMYIQDDKIVYQSSNKDVDIYCYDGYITIYDPAKEYNDRYSYYDIKKKKMVSEKPSYQEESEWEKISKISKFSCEEGEGLMKGDEVVLSCEWDSINFFGSLLYQYLKSQGKDYVMTEKDKSTYIVDLKNGKTVAEFKTKNINDNSLSTFIYYKDYDNDKKVIYNILSGKTYTTDYNNRLSVYSNYITITENGKENYYNTKLKLIYSQDIK